MIEARLAARVLEALVREDYGGLRRLARPDVPPGSPEPGSPEPGSKEPLPAGACPRPGAFLAEAVVPPELRLDEVLALVRRVADPRDDVGAFERECRQALATEVLHEASRSRVLETLRRGGPSAERGPGVFYDTLAAYTDHPVHPAGRCRLGLSERDLLRYAPEFHPVFTMRWAAVPLDRVRSAGRLPVWWPAPEDVGLHRDASRVLLPVHPLTAAGSDSDLLVGARLAPKPYLQVRPTLSMRTVAPVTDPLTHLKVPMPTSTLGLRNRRSIAPRTLVDGALVERVLRRVLDAEPGLPVLLCDEQTYGHADDPFLGYLVRRFPAETAGARVLPVAALLAVAPGGRYVIEELTGSVEEFFGDYLRALLEWNVTLFVKYGIALESHQQNISLVLRPGSLKLLVKDNDSPSVDPHRLSAGLDQAFRPADRRLIATDPEALARVFVTITLHLCAGAIAYGLAARGLLPLATGLGLIRTRLDEALSAFGPDAAFLRERTLDADTLPAKAMLTAGTLVDKTRTGAADINKHYGPPVPNYLSESRNGDDPHIR